MAFVEDDASTRVLAVRKSTYYQFGLHEVGIMWVDPKPSTPRQYQKRCNTQGSTKAFVEDDASTRVLAREQQTSYVTMLLIRHTIINH